MMCIFYIVVRNVFTLLLRPRSMRYSSLIFVPSVIDNQLRPDDIKTQPQLDQSTGHLVPADIIFVCEEVFLGVMRCVADLDEVVLNYEADDTTLLSRPNLLMITQAYIARFFVVDCFDNHIGRGGQGVFFIAHEPSR